MLQKRLYARSAIRGVDPWTADVDLGAFVERLLLFDTFVLDSYRLQELPILVEQFGIEAVIRLFKSDAIELNLDRGHVGIHEVQGGRSIVLEALTFRPVQPTMTERHFGKLKEAYGLQRLSHWRSLSSALRQSIENAPSTCEQRREADLFLYDDMVDTACDPVRVSPYFRAALARYNLDLDSHDVRFNVSLVDDAGAFGGEKGPAFVVETDLERGLGVGRERATSIASAVLHGIAAELYRVHNMGHFRALAPFSREDSSLYRAHLDYVTKQTNPATSSGTFNRIVDIEGVPNLRHPGVAKEVNLHQLLEVRRGPEAVAFREWIWTAADLSDDEVREQLEHHVQSLGQRFSVFLKAPSGRRLRWIAATGAGLAATALAAAVGGPLAATAAASASAAGISYADSFLLDKIIPEAGHPPTPAAFISDRYPSIFAASQ